MIQEITARELKEDDFIDEKTKEIKTVFIENGLMRDGEAEQVVDFFRKLGVTVEVVDAR